MNKYYVTFKQSSRYRNWYLVVQAEDKDDAMRKMRHTTWAEEWSMVYETFEQAGIDLWKLKEIK